MRNIFLLYMPPNNLEAMTHYRDTIQQRVPFERVAPYVGGEVAARLKTIFGVHPIAVWGSRDSKANRAKFEKMGEGDDILIVEGASIKLMGKAALKVVNPDLSRELWKNIAGNSEAGWDLIYFIANPVEIQVPFAKFCELFGYNAAFQLRGLSTVASEKLEQFYEKYDDLYSILARVKYGEPIKAKSPLKESQQQRFLQPPEIEHEDIEDALKDDLVSDHVKMQLKLLSLGRRAGEKVWIPAADQTKLRRVDNRVEFESEFSAGIDLPHSYVENIDVVWKEEFRIDAAFEVENSTAIYSGLLRFADLTILAPNSTYPMFIVAPKERRNRVREQLLRPAFRRLELRDKVRFLPYEMVDEIDRFFPSGGDGLTADVMKAKAEIL